MDEGGIFVPLSNLGSGPIISIPQLVFGIDTSVVGSILNSFSSVSMFSSFLLVSVSSKNGHVRANTSLLYTLCCSALSLCDSAALLEQQSGTRLHRGPMWSHDPHREKVEFRSYTGVILLYWKKTFQTVMSLKLSYTTVATPLTCTSIEKKKGGKSLRPRSPP